MLVFRGTDNLPEWKSPVVAVGSFDGVHLGHVRILRFLREQAARVDGTSVVLTFDPHPRTVLHPESDFFTINSLEKNLHLIEQQGIDATVILPFTMDFSKMPYRQFIQEVIVGTLHTHTLVMGPNHAFGHQREGHHDNIKEYCRDCGLQIVDIPEEMWHSAGVHSAVIRDHIRQHDWSTVNAMLGYPYSKNEECFLKQPRRGKTREAQLTPHKAEPQCGDEQDPQGGAAVWGRVTRIIK